MLHFGLYLPLTFIITHDKKTKTINKFNRTLNIYHSYGKKKRVFMSVTRISVAIEALE